MRYAAIALICLAASALAGPKVFTPLEAPKPRICEKVCPVCGKCWPVPFRGETGKKSQFYYCQTPNRNGAVFTIVDRLTGKADTVGYATFEVDTAFCDSIVWGRVREICRIDTVDLHYSDTVVSYTDQPKTGETQAQWYARCRHAVAIPKYRVDTIYCGKETRAKVSK